MIRNRRRRGEGWEWIVMGSEKQMEDLKVMVGKMKMVIKKGVGEIGGT